MSDELQRWFREAFPARVIVTRENPASMWIEIDIEPAWGEDAAPVENGKLKFGVWRTTGAVYFIHPESGAADDDPIPEDTDLVDWIKERLA